MTKLYLRALSTGTRLSARSMRVAPATLQMAYVVGNNDLGGETIPREANILMM